MKLNRWFVGIAAVVGTFAITAVTAFACTSMSQLNLSQPVGLPGTQVAVSGSSFVPGQAVSLHWATATGPVLATAVADSSGAIGPVPLTIPQSASPGYYPVIATQAGQKGHSYAAVFEVTGNAPPAHAPAAAASGGTSGLTVGLLAVTGIAGLLVSGLGISTVVQRRRGAPSASRVRKP